MLYIDCERLRGHCRAVGNPRAVQISRDYLSLLGIIRACWVAWAPLALALMAYMIYYVPLEAVCSKWPTECWVK